MSRKTEIQVGVTVLIALVILVWALAWLKDYSMNRSSQTWVVEFPETGGLGENDEVLVNGMRKGTVRSMELIEDRVRVELGLAREITITRDSRVAIRNVGLMGEKVIAVELKASGEPYGPDEVIPGVYERGISEVLGQLGETVEVIQRLSGRLESAADLLGKEGDLNQAVRNFNRTSEDLHLIVSENRAALREALGNFAAASGAAKSLVADREGQLKKALDDFASAADKMEGLSGRLDSLRAVIQNVTGKVDRGEGTLGKLVQDEQLYSDLYGSIHSLKELIEDIKKHPKRYLKLSIF